MSFCSRMLTTINRKKILDDDVMETPLKRCLNTVDLTLLGVGHMVGAGIFVLTGTVVHDIAGPGTVLSYFIAGVAATLSSLCYAEFGARVPKAGSAYSYSYVTMGELWAFIIGWNIILEHLLGAASVARAWSGSLDALFNGAIRNGTITHLGRMTGWGLSEYPDFIAMGIVMLILCCVMYGAKVSANFNNFFTIVIMLVIALIISVGFSLADTSNWQHNPEGHNGFLPFGFQGVFAGAATCFYAYIGFEGIAVAGEETKHPEKSIPIATGLSMAIVTVLYVSSSSALTLMVPYSEVDTAAPFPAAFEANGYHWVKVAVAIGALFGITTSLFGGLFSLPRAVYAMSSDGLFFKVFATVHPKTQTPVLSILVFGLIASIFALLFDITTLVEFLSIGTLLSFTFVAACIIILRYQPADKCQFKLKPEAEVDPEDMDEMSDKQGMIGKSQSHADIGKLKHVFTELPIMRDVEPGKAAVVVTITMAILMIAFWCLVLFGYEYVAAASWWAIIILIVISLGIIACIAVLLAHEQNVSFLTFQVPLVPFLPATSMFVNICMMLKLNPLTWIRLAIWMVVGLLIYLTYGMRNSVENKPLAAYNQIVSYASTQGEGQTQEKGTPSPKIDKSLHYQQPKSSMTPPSEH